MLESKSLSHRGAVRENNEDHLAECPAMGFWAVADGVGGNGYGEVASQLATQAMERKIRQGATLAEAIVGADEAVKNAVASNAEYSGMATTVVACRFDDHHFEVSWVGDSRAYLIDTNGICQISSDHNLAQELLDQGQISAQQARSHRGQHELTQAIGSLSLDNIPKSLGELHDGDVLLLCTDGLSGVLSDQQIYETVVGAGSLDAAADTLLQHVLDKGAPDNITLTLIQYRKQEAPIKASDFAGQGIRFPFDRSPYASHCKNRPWFLLVLLMAICALVYLI